MRADMPKQSSFKVPTSGDAVPRSFKRKGSGRDWSVPPLRLYMLKGSFFIQDDHGAAAMMDTEVWSKLPEEMIWEVMRFVPAAAHFRWHSVSRKWHEVLTSATFRNTLTSAVAASRQLEERQRHPRVVAGATMAPRPDEDSSSKLKVVEIDQPSFVPSWFWKHDSTVEAAADGLVCISNHSAYGTGECGPEETPRFCVLNPLTRTCKVLPELRVPVCEFEPRVWIQPAVAAATVFGYTSEDRMEAGEAHVATCDLGAASGERDLAPAYKSITGIRTSLLDSLCPSVALCAGETFLYDVYDCQLRVLVPGPGGRLVDAAILGSPPVAMLGIDASLHPDTNRWRVSLVAHRGTLLYVEALNRVDVVMGVWRLARARLEWEAVARLDVAEVERATGLECIKRDSGHVGCSVWSARGVRELLYCSVSVGSMRFKLGLNLDTGEWELVHDDQSPVTYSTLVGLRPDVFL